MKEELSRKEVTRDIWNGFDVCLKCRVDLGIKIWEKVTKTHIMGTFGWHVPVHLEHVPVHFGFWSFLANVYRYTLGVYWYTLFCFSYFDQFLYFGHNFLISYLI